MNYQNISKIVSHALRHEPEKYDLKIMHEGWVSINELLEGIKRIYPKYKLITRLDIEKAIECSDKKRHEIVGDKIRALYGHSKKVISDQIFSEPPKMLYHGTNIQNSSIIINEGIKKMERQYVHLSASIDEAVIVAKRRKGEISVLEVNAEKAYDAGVKFIIKGNVWLCDFVPAKFLRLLINDLKS